LDFILSLKELILTLICIREVRVLSVDVVKVILVLKGLSDGCELTLLDLEHVGFPWDNAHTQFINDVEVLNVSFLYPSDDVCYIVQPDHSIVIDEKEAFHLHDLVVVDLRHIVRDSLHDEVCVFKGLLRPGLLVLRHRVDLVVDLAVRVLFIEVRKESDDERSPDSVLGLNTCLNAIKVFPDLAVTWSVLHELREFLRRTESDVACGMVSLLLDLLSLLSELHDDCKLIRIQGCSELSVVDFLSILVEDCSVSVQSNLLKT
jgi:hypothetical protein